MVERLPPQGVSLGGNDKVPIQAAMYYSSMNDTNSTTTAGTKRPIAITFQAHPEYGSQSGVDGTLNPIVRLMEERGDVTSNEAKEAQEDAKLQLDGVQEQSINAMIAAGRLLGWFPKE